MRLLTTQSIREAAHLDMAINLKSKIYRRAERVSGAKELN